jgi:hypothetical protein
MALHGAGGRRGMWLPVIVNLPGKNRDFHHPGPQLRL